MKEIKILDTFAGAGGFSLGFEMAGCEIIGAIESDAWACDTFKFNHPNAIVIKKDIRKVTNKELLNKFSSANKPDIILGGPPCQGFSICNKENGDPKDPRNSLFKEFIRTGKVLKPKVMIMENVANLIKARAESQDLVIDIIKDELEFLGYNVYIKLLEAVHYGVPQIRKRLFVIASIAKLETPFPKLTHQIVPDSKNGNSYKIKKTPTLWEAISDLPTINAREGSEIMEYSLPPQNKLQTKLRNKSKLLHNHRAMKHSKRMV